jgi:hypothetical protein
MLVWIGFLSWESMGFMELCGLGLGLVALPGTDPLKGAGPHLLPWKTVRHKQPVSDP